jgi:hypothetical protein
LWNLGDVHRGDESCDVDLFQRAIKMIYKSPDTRWISTGDLLNVALKSSKSSPYSSLSLEKEVEELAKDLAPIADKCLGFVGSNHHLRLMRETGLNLDKIIANRLGIPYLGAIGKLGIFCSTSLFMVAMHHGVGGGKTLGAKANVQDRLRTTIAPCYDLYLLGHTHTYLESDASANLLIRRDVVEITIPQKIVTTAHCLDYDDSYAPDMMLEERPKGFAVITLKGSRSGNQDKKEIKATRWS